MLKLMVEAWSEWEWALYDRSSQRVACAIYQFRYNGTFIFEVMPLAHSFLFLFLSLSFAFAYILCFCFSAHQYGNVRWILAAEEGKRYCKTISFLLAQNLNVFAIDTWCLLPFRIKLSSISWVWGRTGTPWEDLTEREKKVNSSNIPSFSPTRSFQTHISVTACRGIAEHWQVVYE